MQQHRPELDPRRQSQLIFDNGAKAIQWRDNDLPFSVGYSRAKKNYDFHKIKMDHRAKCQI